jgi:hypothetical protein
LLRKLKGDLIAMEAGHWVAKRQGRTLWSWGEGVVARDSGWGLLLGMKEGLRALGKGPIGMKERALWPRGGVGRVVWGHGGAPSTPKTPPSQQTPQKSTHQDVRAVSAVTIFSPQHILPSFTNGPWQTKARGAVASPWHCPRPRRVARRGAAAPRRGVPALPGPHVASKACCRWPSRRALRSQIPLRNP